MRIVILGAGAVGGPFDSHPLVVVPAQGEMRITEL